MTLASIDTRSFLASLVGRQIRSFHGGTATVLELREDVVVIRTTPAVESRPPADVRVPVEWVQWGIDRLVRVGEAPAFVEAFGRRGELLSLLLLMLPGVEPASRPRIASPDRRAWSLRPLQAVRRVDLHDQFGASRRKRISSSASTANVFIVLEQGQAESARWHEDVLLVRGQSCGQSLGNADLAVLEHRQAGRALRVFWERDADVVYAGEFELDPAEPFEFVEAPDPQGAPGPQIVFRLLPVGAMVLALGEAAEEGLDRGGDGDASSIEERVPVGADREAAGHLARIATLVDASAAVFSNARLLLARGLRFLGARGPWPHVLLCSCAAVAMTNWAWTSSPARPALTTWFLLLCPGMALVRLLPSRGVLTRLVLAVATSLAIETVVSVAMLEGRAWSSSATLGILIVVSVAASSVELWTASRTVPVARPGVAPVGSRSG